MKKILAFVVCMVGSVAAFAAVPEPQVPAPAQEERYESVLITMWENAPMYQMNTATYGAKIGILGSAGAPVYGAEGAVITAGSENVYGFKGALVYTTGKLVEGVLLAPVNWVDKFTGVAFGIVNVADCGGIQIGIVNFMKNGFLPCFPVINFPVCK